MAASDVEVTTHFGKVTTVALRLPSGFVVTASAGVTDIKNYDKASGRGECLKKIRSTLWDYEVYKNALN